MRFLFKKKPKPKEYFHLQYSSWIGIREEHYREIHSKLPFHTASISSDFAIISFDCPFFGLNYRKQFFHLGKRLDIAHYKDRLKQEPVFPVLTEDIDTDIKEYNNCELLSSTFNPCAMCEREMQCLFAPKNLSYKPKSEYNQEAVINTLQENGFIESKELYHKFVAFSEEQHYHDMGPQTVGEFFTLIILLIPLIIILVPWLIFSSILEKFEGKE